MSNDVGEFWNEKYSTEDYRYGKRPNAFVAAEARQRIRLGPGAGRVLCAGDGEGRNGVWLAEQGYRVLSLDPSDVGMAKAEALADERDVELETKVAALPDPELPDASFDGVVLTFVHLPPERRQRVHADVVRLLKPGGAVLLEGFRPEHFAEGLDGGPPDDTLMFTEDMLREDFSDLDIELLESARVELDEGEFHRGPSEVVRLVARKPSD